MRLILPHLRLLTLRLAEVPLLHKMLTCHEISVVLASLVSEQSPSNLPDTLCSITTPRICCKGFECKTFQVVRDKVRKPFDDNSTRFCSYSPLKNTLTFTANALVFLTGIEFVCQIKQSQLLTINKETGVFELPTEEKQYDEHLRVKISHPETRVVEFELKCQARLALNFYI